VCGFGNDPRTLDPAFDEQLEIIKALEDADYWDASPSSQDESEGGPDFDAL
jgi:hypothetical protein